MTASASTFWCEESWSEHPEVLPGTKSPLRTEHCCWPKVPPKVPLKVKIPRDGDIRILLEDEGVRSEVRSLDHVCVGRWSETVVGWKEVVPRWACLHMFIIIDISRDI